MATLNRIPFNEIMEIFFICGHKGARFNQVGRSLNSISEGSL